MANFAGLGSNAMTLAAQCCNNNNKQDIAEFIMHQEHLLHAGNIKARTENANKPAQKAGANTQGGGDKKTQALNRLKAHMK
jgi:hypothetical protein